jgi:hypothetical protein
MAMKLTLIASLVSCSLLGSCQVHWDHASDWKLYQYDGHRIFTIPIDSLKTYNSLSMDQDSMAIFVRSAKYLDTKAPLVWMGGYVATCSIGGALRKVELSRYGGYFFDEKTSAYYQLPTEKIDAWLAFIQNSYLAFIKLKP